MEREREGGREGETKRGEGARQRACVRACVRSGIPRILTRTPCADTNSPFSSSALASSRSMSSLRPLRPKCVRETLPSVLVESIRSRRPVWANGVPNRAPFTQTVCLCFCLCGAVDPNSVCIQVCVGQQRPQFVRWSCVLVRARATPLTVTNG